MAENVTPNQISTTGTSVITGKQDGNPYHGVHGSMELAKTDLERMRRYTGQIQSVSREKRIHPSFMCGIISRESRAGEALNNGWGDHGNAFGLMQVDRNWYPPVGAWNSVEHMLQCTQILKDKYGEIECKFPDWTPPQKMKGALAAYNAGTGRVSSFANIDAGTTGGDYSNDVVARAQYYMQFPEFR